MLPASWSAPDVRRAVVVLAAAGHTALYLSVAPISLADLSSTDLIVELRHPRWAGAWIILLFVGKRFLPTFVTGPPATETSRRQERTQVFKTGVGGFAAVLSMWIALAKTPAAARTLAQVDTPGATQPGAMHARRPFVEPRGSPSRPFPTDPAIRPPVCAPPEGSRYWAQGHLAHLS